MQILFVHNNFPAQFRGLAGELAKSPEHRVVAIGSETAQDMPGVKVLRYRMPFFNVSQTHPFARRLDVESRRATQVMYVLSELRVNGFEPDLVIGHCGWGEMLPIRGFYPKAKIVTYCEYYYQREGQDVHFDDEDSRFGLDGMTGLHMKNAATVLSLLDSDLGLSPTEWQKQTYPPEFLSKIHVVHEGVDGVRLKPDPNARFELPGGRILHRGDEIVTFIARNLEPMRGYHKFMRALPDILAARPKAEAVIVGGDEVSYGPVSDDGRSWKSVYLDEVAGRLDLSRVHFLPHQPYDRFVELLQTSTVHVYLTAPFVLSWSMIEAMAIGCVVIGSDTPPVREAIADGVNGLLTSFHDHEALARKVVDVLASPAAFAPLGQRARKTALERYGRAECLREVMQVLGITPGPTDAAPPVYPTEPALAVAPAAGAENALARPSRFMVRRSRGAADAAQDNKDMA